MGAARRPKFWGLDDSVGYLARIAFRRFSAAVERQTSPFGVSAGQYGLLNRLWDADGVAQHALSGRSATCEPSIAVMVRRLEELGLLHREVNPSNRRETLVYLSDRARNPEATLKAAGRNANALATRGLSREEVTTLRALLRRVIENLELAEAAVAGDESAA